MKKNIFLPKKPSLTHLALHVSHVSNSIVFYSFFCQLELVHRREGKNGLTVWLAEKKDSYDFVLVLISGGKARTLQKNDYSHLGFSLQSKKDVDSICKLAKERSCLLWPATQAPYPVGYYCGVSDPDGNTVEFSYDQPIGEILNQ